MLQGLGLSLPTEDVETHIRVRNQSMRALGDSYGYRDTDGVEVDGLRTALDGQRVVGRGSLDRR